MTFRSTRLMNRSRILATSDKTASAAPPTIKRHARERGLTLRQVALEAASPRPRFTGTASDVADGLQLWFEQHAADGFIIQGGTPETFPRFVDEVVPLLQARGLFRRDYPGTTLRESLGLALPANQFQK